MLKNIPPILSPELLKVLCEMGHSDRICIGDGNFPGANMAKAKNEVVTLLRDIQKKLSGLATDLNTIKTTLKAIQGEETDHTLTDIARALDRIEESMY